MEKREPSYTVGDNVNLWNRCSHYGEQYAGSFKKLQIELPYATATPFLGKYLEKTQTWKDICTPMFTAVLFKIPKTWKQPKC